MRWTRLLRRIFIAAKIENQKRISHAMNIGGHGPSLSRRMAALFCVMGDRIKPAVPWLSGSTLAAAAHEILAHFAKAIGRAALFALLARIFRLSRSLSAADPAVPACNTFTALFIMPGPKHAERTRPIAIRMARPVRRIPRCERGHTAISSRECSFHADRTCHNFL